MVTSRNAGPCGSVHGGALVTGNTVHLRFCRVNISLAPFSKEFIPHAAAVAGRTLIEGIRTPLKQMAIEKSILRCFRPAHMTPPASGMAIGAVALITRKNLIPFAHVRPGF